MMGERKYIDGEWVFGAPLGLQDVRMHIASELAEASNKKICKGRCIETGEWVGGELVSHGEIRTVVTLAGDGSREQMINPPISYEHWKVDPETIHIYKYDLDTEEGSWVKEISESEKDYKTRVLGMFPSQEVKITYRGWKGHFCASDQCEFSLNTLLEFLDTKVVVSTIGRYRRFPDDTEFSEIGVNRYIETMAFHAEKSGQFYDADVAREIEIHSEWSYDSPSKEMEATKGHWAVVDEIKDRLLSGDIREGGG